MSVMVVSVGGTACRQILVPGGEESDSAAQVITFEVENVEGGE